MSSPRPETKSLIDNYLKRLGTEPTHSVPGSVRGLESPSSAPVIDLSECGIRDTIGKLRDRLETFASRYYSDVRSKSHSDCIQRICRSVESGLTLLQRRDEVGLLNNAEAVAGLEGIIATDGSRPMYLIKDNQVDFRSDNQLLDRSGATKISGNSLWAQSLQRMDQEGLYRVMGSVGTIRHLNREDAYGTGFLVAPDLLMTNGHVWNKIGEDNGQDYSRIIVDFQHEFQGGGQISIRRLRSLAYLGSRQRDVMNPNKTHYNPDVALFVLEPEAAAGHPEFFRIHSGRWNESPGSFVFVSVIGHPTIEANNPFAEFMKPTSGFKRLSPGTSRLAKDPTYAYHDASTTGGSSGSVLVSPSASSPMTAVGIHYAFGDTRTGLDTPTNCAQVLPHILETYSEAVDQTETDSLRQILSRYGAVLCPDSFPYTN
jgi:endonuclease G